MVACTLLDGSPECVSRGDCGAISLIVDAIPDVVGSQGASPAADVVSINATQWWPAIAEILSKAGNWQLVDSEGPSALRFFHLIILDT